MTAKEKAKELILKFAFKGAQHEGEAKQFALIAVDEILDASLYYFDELSPYVINWQEVKQEILKL
jgi:hypothetical protein